MQDHFVVIRSLFFLYNINYIYTSCINILYKKKEIECNMLYLITYIYTGCIVDRYIGVKKKLCDLL